MKDSLNRKEIYDLILDTQIPAGNVSYQIYGKESIEAILDQFKILLLSKVNNIMLDGELK